jgi:hypothetical protein
MSIATVTGIDALIEGFPHKPSKILGLPTFETLKELKLALEANASSVTSNLGGGRHGYLGAVIDAQTYAIIVGNNAAGAAQPFIIPTFPGVLPVVVGGNQAAREEELRVFNVASHAWREYNNVTNALRKQILGAVDETYLSPLKDDHTGYSGVTLQDMLEHLFTAYGVIQEHDLVLNEARLMESWDGSSPFEAVITRINQCVAYAAYAGNPYSPGQILAKVFHVVFQTGLIHIACREWKRLPAAQRTNANFKTHIVLAQQDNRNEQRTSKEAGYGLAAQAKKMEIITENFAHFVTTERTSQALALAAANEEKLASDAANKIALQNITNQYLQLSKKFDEAMAKMKAPMPTTNPLRVIAPRDRKPSVDSGSYCWSHGFHVASFHTSATCRTPKPGHQVAATRQNPMGGNLQGKPTI